MKRILLGPARRYARALLDVATLKADPGILRGDLRAVADLLRQNRELSGILNHPAIKPESKKKIIAATFGSGRVTPLCLRLLELLAERDRLALFPAIEDAFSSMWNAHRGVVAAEAVSVSPLDLAQRDALSGAIRQATGHEVELKTATDPALLGGLLLRMSGKTYDGSVRARLAALKRRLVQGARVA